MSGLLLSGRLTADGGSLLAFGAGLLIDPVSFGERPRRS